MKAIMTGLLKGRVARWSMLAVLLAAVGLSVCGMSPGYYRLSGAWIGSGGGIIWNAVQIPLDCAGNTMVLRVNGLEYGEDMAGLLRMFGANALSEFIGEVVMTSRDTATYTTVAYAVAQGNPQKIQAIVVMPGTMTFTGRDSADIAFTMYVYSADADADKDGFPDPGATPVVAIPGQGISKRVRP